MIRLNNPDDWIWLILFFVTVTALLVFILRNRWVLRGVKIGLGNLLVAAILLYVLRGLGLDMPLNPVNAGVLAILGLPGLAALLIFYKVIV